MIFFILCFGLIIGSFLNVCISRMPEEKDIVFLRSHCPNCKHKIPWYWNIPIISFLILLRKCAYCKQPISWRYPVVEILTACLFFFVTQKYEYYQIWPFHFYFMSALIIATFIDLKHWIIPDLITLPGIVVGIIGNIFFGPQPILDSFFGALVGGGSLLLVATIYSKWKNIEGIGGGDIKFLAMIGAFLGIKNTILTLVLSSLLGSIIGVFWMMYSGKGGKTAIPFGPFLALAALLAYFFGNEIIYWYFISSRNLLLPTS